MHTFPVLAHPQEPVTSKPSGSLWVASWCCMSTMASQALGSESLVATMPAAISPARHSPCHDHSLLPGAGHAQAFWEPLGSEWVGGE